MRNFTVETAYHLPVYRRRTYLADTPLDACLLALDDEGWDDAEEDVDTSGETFVIGIWDGSPALHDPGIPVPEQFGETVERKAALFDDLVALLREPAQPMGISQHDFVRWLPRAMAALAKADAIGGKAAAS